MRATPLLVLIVLTADLTLSANILVMLPLPLFSHTYNFMPIFRELAARGHNVTIVSPYPQNTPVPNLTDIVVPNLRKELFDEPMTERNFVEMDGVLADILGMWIFGALSLRKILECEAVQNVITDTESKFDLIIEETWFAQEPFIALGHKFNAPVISIAATSILPKTSELTGNMLPVSYVPVPKLPYSDRMSFVQRLWNSFYYYWDIILGNVYLCFQDYAMRVYFKYPGSENLPYITDLLRNTSLTLMDSNFAINYPAPLQRNVVEFGGINVKKGTKLPPDLQKFMDSAKKGVIYLSFGSFLNISALPQELQKTLINALGKVEQKVLIKMEKSNPNIELLKANILAKPWLPQASILAHPNCKLFITHGGIHGLMEGVYNAVPMVAIPLISDQKFNAKFIEATSIGKVLKHRSINEELLLEAINEVINNSSYRDKINVRSAIFKDTPISTMDNVIYWIEYVIRHKGAPHLRPAVLDLYWFQYFLLDVVAFYLFLLILLVFIIKFILVSLFNCIKCLIRGKQVTNKSKKKME